MASIISAICTSVEGYNFLENFYTDKDCMKLVDKFYDGETEPIVDYLESRLNEIMNKFFGDFIDSQQIFFDQNVTDVGKKKIFVCNMATYIYERVFLDSAPHMDQTIARQLFLVSFCNMTYDLVKLCKDVTPNDLYWAIVESFVSYICMFQFYDADKVSPFSQVDPPHRLTYTNYVTDMYDTYNYFNYLLDNDSSMNPRQNSLVYPLMDPKDTQNNDKSINLEDPSQGSSCVEDDGCNCDPNCASNCVCDFGTNDNCGINNYGCNCTCGCGNDCTCGDNCNCNCTCDNNCNCDCNCATNSNCSCNCGPEPEQKYYTSYDRNCWDPRTWNSDGKKRKNENLSNDSPSKKMK